MKSLLGRTVCLISVIFIGFALVSCSRDPAGTGDAPGLTPEQAKAAEEQRKRIDESKKTIAAKVNDVPISMRDLIEEMNAIAPQYIRPGDKSDPSTDEKIRKEALDRLIYRELAVQHAKREGMAVAQGAVAEEMNSLKAEMKTKDAFRRKLIDSGTTEDELAKRIERNILIEMITEKEIFGKVAVDPGEARKVYARKKKSFKGPSGPMTFEEARPLIEKELKTAAVHKREDEWVAELRKTARIEIAAGPGVAVAPGRK